MEQLKNALAKKGFRVKDLHERINRKYAMSYDKVARYCRCCRRVRLYTNSTEEWSIIDDCLKEMEVHWNE